MIFLLKSHTKMAVDSKSYMGQEIDQKILGKHFSTATNEELKKNGTYSRDKNTFVRL